MINKKYTKIVLIHIFICLLILFLMKELTSISTEKTLIVIGVLYLIFGAFELMDYIENNGISNLLIRSKNISRFDFIREKESNKCDTEVFSRFFNKSNENKLFNSILYIVLGFVLIMLENIVK